jgi:EAL domain-containing protein (putative c-di-GMP-specific phosphodiesterase class I)
MAFQPIVRWSQRCVFGYEALVRTREPSVPHPGVLLDLAERVGGLDQLGRSIRNSVAGQLAAEDSFNVFVNLHPMDLLDPQLFAADAPLTRFANRVVLEITERESLEHIEELGPRLADLKRRGFRIAIDDLGAGYAGLSSFSALEPDVVKLDMSLVRGVQNCRTAQKVIASIRGLCDALGTQVVAEGIETVEERDTLANLGCDLMQGYLFGRPAPYLPTVKFE